MKAIVKKVEKKFWIAQAIAALMGLSAIIVWAQCPGLQIGRASCRERVLSVV